MTIQQLQERIAEAKARIIAELPDQTQRAAADLAAAIKNRIVQSGINANGQKFTPYSTNQVPAYKYLLRGRNRKADAAVKALAKKGETISYKQYRELNGLKTAFKNFEFTGEMWRGVEVGEPEQTRVRVNVRIQGGDATTQAKLSWHSEREGVSLLDPTVQEEDQARQRMLAWLTKTIQDSLR